MGLYVEKDWKTMGLEDVFMPEILLIGKRKGHYDIFSSFRRVCNLWKWNSKTVECEWWESDGARWERIRNYKHLGEVCCCRWREGGWDTGEAVQRWRGAYSTALWWTAYSWPLHVGGGGVVVCYIRMYKESTSTAEVLLKTSVQSEKNGQRDKEDNGMSYISKKGTVDKWMKGLGNRMNVRNGWLLGR